MAQAREVITIEAAVMRRFEKESDDGSSLSAAELIASVHVLRRTLTLSQSEIVEWICAHHPYFRRRWASDGEADAPVIQKLSEGVNDYIHLLDAPLTLDERSDGDVAVSISTGALYSLLKPIIPVDSPKVLPDKPTASGCFPFHKLPEELKLMIFRHLFAYPDDRLSFESSNGSIVFACLAVPAGGWIEEPFWRWAPSLAHLLAPTLVCNKEFNRLTCLTFYSLNHFQCRDVSKLHWFLRGMGAEGRKYLKHITVRYYRLKEAHKLVRMIEDCVSLESLTLVFDINHKDNGKIEVIDDKHHDKYTYEKPSHIPGLKELKTILLSKKPEILEILAAPTSQCVEIIKTYMNGVVSGSD
jgi:hypothetical protein